MGDRAGSSPVIRIKPLVNIKFTGGLFLYVKELMSLEEIKDETVCTSHDDAGNL